MSAVDLRRYLDGYRDSLDQALAELNDGRKRSHWMWYIFPQVGGLGTSPAAVQYALSGRAEAEAFLAHPTLGRDFRTLVEVVWHQVIDAGVSLRDLFGRPDDQKLVSSLTLFAGVAADLGDEWATFVNQANDILERAREQGLPRCVTSERVLAG